MAFDKRDNQQESYLTMVKIHLRKPGTEPLVYANNIHPANNQQSLVTTQEGKRQQLLALHCTRHIVNLTSHPASR